LTTLVLVQRSVA